MIMKKLILMTCLMLMLGFVPAANATFSTYSSQAAFIAAAGPVLTENFDDATLVPGLSITEVNGAGSIHDGVYENIVNASYNRYQVYNFAGGMTAFGAWLDLYNPGGPGSEIDIYIDDTDTYIGTIPSSSNGDFFGFVNSYVFYGVRFQDAQFSQLGGIQETYYNVDLSLAPAPVPIPAALFLLGPGLLGLVGLRRRILG
jgi:hypothetical protein